MPKYTPHAFICESIIKHIGAQNMLSYFRSHYTYTVFNRTRDAFKLISGQMLSVAAWKNPELIKHTTAQDNTAEYIISRKGDCM